MAKLSENPKGWELEDFVAAHFVSRGAYVETGITARDPTDLLELDVVWTDYRRPYAERIAHPVEVKSGDCGISDVFKFYGWTRYLDSAPGQFLHTDPIGQADQPTVQRLQEKLGIKIIHVTNVENVGDHFVGLGLGEPAAPHLPGVWRFSFWAQRRLLQSLNAAIKAGVCPESAKVAKGYRRLVNDAVFFASDIQSRVRMLLDAHWEHPKLALTAANEAEGNGVDFEDPHQCGKFKQALYHGKLFPVQACFYLAHRARLYILKAAVDYWCAKQAGDIEKKFLKVGGKKFELADSELYRAFLKGTEQLAASPTFERFPTFWQVFLWGWGGFLLTDRLEEEYSALAAETGVPVVEIPKALEAFDLLFPTEGGWLRQVDERRVIQQMPAAIRGVGAFHRLQRQGVKEYAELKCPDWTRRCLGWDNNTGARLLDGGDGELVK